jgi:GMP synthase-like glutamine amidotransferase
MSEEQIPRAALINNYSETKGSERLRRLKASIELFPAIVQTFLYNDIPMEKLRRKEFDCLILSGSDLNVSNLTDRQKMDAEINQLKEIEIPVLAICFGLHLAVYAYGGKIERNESSDEFCIPYGKEIAIEIQNDPDGLICCPKAQVQVNVNHKDYVSPDDPQLLKSFEVRSVSNDKDKRYLQYAKHKEKAIFCVQFHPESFDSATPIVQETGSRIIHNFLNIVLKIIREKVISGS